MSLTRVVRLAAAVLAAALLASCTGDDSDPTPATEQEVPEDGASGGGGDVHADRESPDGAESADASSDGATEIDPSFLTRRAPRLLPHDYEIGPLQDLIAAGHTEREAIGTLLSLLSALAEGTIAEAAIAADRRQSLSRSLQFHVRDGPLPQAVRIGALTVVEDQIHVSVRLFGEPGRVAGEVYLEATPSGWLVADLQLDLQRLAQPYTAPAEFEPSVVRRFLPSP